MFQVTTFPYWEGVAGTGTANVTLRAGQTYTLRTVPEAGYHIDGALVTATAPIVVVSFTQCAWTFVSFDFLSYLCLWFARRYQSN
jgi:hypothetical protein